MTRRLNARIDAPLAQKVAALRRSTRKTTTEVVRTALERYYDAVARETRPYEILREAGFIGCAEGPPDLSVSYKAALFDDVGPAHAEPRPTRKRAPKR